MDYSLFDRLKNQPLKTVQQQFAKEHEKVFAKTDCLDCAGCCKNISPIVEFEDIHRIAPVLGLKPGEFITQYLEMDEEGDFVFTTQPCPMLQANNKCKIYDVAPRACRSYPHTDEIENKAQVELALQNAQYCPAVEKMFEGIFKAIKD